MAPLSSRTSYIGTITPFGILLLLGLLVPQTTGQVGTPPSDALCMTLPDIARNDCGPPGVDAGTCRSLYKCCYDGTINQCFHPPVDPSKCAMTDIQRIDCGQAGMTAAACHAKTCCWNSVTSNIPWCFYPMNPPPDEDLCSVILPRDTYFCGPPSVTEAQCPSLGCCWNSTANFCYYPPDSVCAAMPHDQREDCGFPFIDPSYCISKGCCFQIDDEDTSDGVPWCYRKQLILDLRVCLPNNNMQSCPTAPIGGCVSDGSCCSFPAPIDQAICWAPTVVADGVPVTCSVATKIPCTASGSDPGPNECQTRQQCCYDANPTDGIYCFYREVAWSPTSSGDKRVCPADGGNLCSDGDTEEKCLALQCCYEHNQGTCVESVSDDDAVCDPSKKYRCGPDNGNVNQIVCESTLGCCFRDGGCWFYTNAVSTTTTIPTTTDAEPTTKAATTPSGPFDYPEVQSMYSPAGLPPPGVVCDLDEPLEYLPVHWYVNGAEYVSEDNLGTDRLRFQDEQLPMGTNPEFVCCVEDGQQSHCSNPWRPVYLEIEGDLSIEEGEYERVPYQVVGWPELVCSSSALASQAEVMFSPSPGIFSTCSGLSDLINQAPIVHGTDGCAWRTQASYSEISLSNSLLLFGTVDNRVDETESYYKVDLTFSSNGIHLCTVDLGEVEVEVEDVTTMKSECLLSEGMVRTFGGEILTNQGVGVFVLYKHPTLPQAVHVQLKSVKVDGAGNSVSKPCGAIISVAGNIYSFSRCGDKESYIIDQSMVKTADVKDEGPPPGFFITRDESQYRHRIYFPTGTIVSIYSGEVRGIPFFHVGVTPAPHDSGAQGLCGEPPSEDVSSIVKVDDHAAVEEFDSARLDDETWEATESQLKSLENYQTYTKFCHCDPRVMSCMSQPYDRCLSGDEDVTNAYFYLPPWDASSVDDTTGYAQGRPSWPTRSGISLFHATQQCQQWVDNVKTQCEEILDSEAECTVTSCVHAIGMSDNMDAGEVVVQGLKEMCWATLIKIIGPNTPTPPYLGLNQCSQRGTVYFGVCRCYDGFFGPDCSTPSGTLIVYKLIPSICDPSESPCDTVVVTGLFDPDREYTCNVEYIVTSENGIQSVQEVEYRAGQVSINQIVCPVPQKQSAFISIKDDTGQTSRQLPFLVYDPRCWLCTTSPVKCVRRFGGCVIYGKCVAPDKEFGGSYDVREKRSTYEEKLHQGTKCFYCDPRRDPDRYSVKRDPRCEDMKRPEDDEPKWKFMLLVGASVLLALAFICICCCTCWKCGLCGAYGRHDDHEDSHSCSDTSNESSTYGIMPGGHSHHHHNSTLGVYAPRKCYPR